MSVMMKRPRRLHFIYFVLFSLGLHFLSGIGVYLGGLLNPKPVPQTVQFEIIEPKEVTPTETKAEVVNRKALPVMKNQIVDQEEQALNDEIPEDARFLSRNNQVVQKQTIARDRGEFKNKQTKETEKGQNGMAKSPPMIDLKPKFDVAKSIQDRVEREKAFDKAATEGFVPVRAEETGQTKAQDQAAGGAAKGGETSQSLDYIKDLDSGLETLLSTKEFVYYSYFNRIRNQLNQYWSDKVRTKLSEMYKKGRNIASADDKVTKCLVTLDTSGKLLRIQIIGDSGVHELDEAAVEAFKSAAPFPNPPKGMIDPDGTIKIRWDFILEA